jgi:hypothetical protein
VSVLKRTPNELAARFYFLLLLTHSETVATVYTL